MANVTKIKLNGEIRDIVSDKAVRDDEGNVIKSSYGSSLDVNNGKNLILKSKTGDTLSTVTIPGNSVVSELADGLAPKITNVNGYLKGDGTWSIPNNSTIYSSTEPGGQSENELWMQDYE